MKRRPIIGLTPDVGSTPARPGRPPVPRYELKQAYADAVLAAGGLPIVLPYSEDETAAAEVVSLCDALVITGGNFDIPPESYGATRHKQLGDLKPERTQYERRVLRAALDAGLPVLGVCGGMQLLAVELGGSLFQDIGDEVEGAFDHEQKSDPREPGHPARIAEGSQLAQIMGRVEIQVNSTHHQAVREPGSARISALSPDGIVEAIEVPGRFAIGVQWHPELLAADEHLALYRALVAHARVPEAEIVEGDDILEEQPAEVAAVSAVAGEVAADDTEAAARDAAAADSEVSAAEVEIAANEGEGAPGEVEIESELAADEGDGAAAEVDANARDAVELAANDGDTAAAEVEIESEAAAEPDLP